MNAIQGHRTDGSGVPVAAPLVREGRCTHGQRHICRTACRERFGAVHDTVDTGICGSGCIPLSTRETLFSVALARSLGAWDVAPFARGSVRST
jgi:hypothetical protein